LVGTSRPLSITPNLDSSSLYTNNPVLLSAFFVLKEIFLSSVSEKINLFPIYSSGTYMLVLSILVPVFIFSSKTRGTDKNIL
jgi:hypothetical protein